MNDRDKKSIGCSFSEQPTTVKKMPTHCKVARHQRHKMTTVEPAVIMQQLLCVMQANAGGCMWIWITLQKKKTKFMSQVKQQTYLKCQVWRKLACTCTTCSHDSALYFVRDSRQKYTKWQFSVPSQNKIPRADIETKICTVDDVIEVSAKFRFGLWRLPYGWSWSLGTTFFLCEYLGLSVTRTAHTAPSVTLTLYSNWRNLERGYASWSLIDVRYPLVSYPLKPSNFPASTFSRISWHWNHISTRSMAKNAFRWGAQSNQIF